MLTAARVVGLVALCATACAYDPPTGAGDNAPWPSRPELDAQLLDVMARFRFPGLSACTVEDGVVAWCGVYGVADADIGTPVTLDTRFLAGSVSKVVVALTALRLADEGVVDLDAPIAGAVDVRIPDSHAGLSLRHLLTHTGGLRDRWPVIDAARGLDEDAAEPLGDFLVRTLDPDAGVRPSPWGPVPGRDWSYANVGTALAAYVLGGARGFDVVSDEAVYVPLGLPSPTWRLADLPVDAPLAAAHHVRAGREHPLPQEAFVIWPAGQLRTRADHLATVVAAVASRDPGFLSAASYEALDTPQTALDLFPFPVAFQALGPFGIDVGDQVAVGHGGSTFGIEAGVAWVPGTGRAAVFLANGDGAGGAFAMRSQKRLLGLLLDAADAR